MIGLEMAINQSEIKINELAKILNVKQPQINAWKKGERKIPEHYLKTLSEIFNRPKEFFQSKPKDELIIEYYKKIIEKELGKQIEIFVRET